MTNEERRLLAKVRQTGARSGIAPVWLDKTSDGYCAKLFSKNHCYFIYRHTAEEALLDALTLLSQTPPIFPKEAVLE
ncbi:MAG: hypothetical protein JRI39_00395 [Deltaproteobacteria bacterium]|nr:hypothetical protein [Deltaproteobacteria bacterium]